MCWVDQDLAKYLQCKLEDVTLQPDNHVNSQSHPTAAAISILGSRRQVDLLGNCDQAGPGPILGRAYA